MYIDDEYAVILKVKKLIINRIKNSSRSGLYFAIEKRPMHKKKADHGITLIIDFPTYYSKATKKVKDRVTFTITTTIFGVDVQISKPDLNGEYEKMLKFRLDTPLETFIKDLRIVLDECFD